MDDGDSLLAVPTHKSRGPTTPPPPSRRALSRCIEPNRKDTAPHNASTLDPVRSAPLKEVQRDDPFVSPVVAPELGTGQEEEPPVDVPLPFLPGTVGLGQDGLELAGPPALVEVVQPPVAGLFVVLSVDPPVVDDRELLGKVQQEVVAGHSTAGEKVLAHPPLFEFVAIVLVGKNVDEEFSTVGLEPAVDLVEEVLVVLHVFEHLDGHDQVVVLDDVEGTLVVGNVAGDDRDVFDVVSAGLSGRENVLALRCAVGNPRDLGVGVILGQVEGQTPPSASQIHDAHAVLDAGVLAILF
mmetsp:Transcript_17529/g.36038  ORF Transcript_17529/g.36038 Transcript_17529/m.36038 type:complete len:296 (-) Transcript_17529:704-1591(-)